MNFLLIGVNHNSAPVEVRERFAIAEPQLAEAVSRLCHHPGIEEGMILSTCNRVEVLARSQNGSAGLRAFIGGYFRTAPENFAPYFYEFCEQQAVRHLFRVASSLDSMIVGEPQILGQLKEAYATARAVGGVHSQLDALVTRAFAVAKRVRTETGLATSAVSVASVAVDLAKKIFGSLAGRSIYLVGAGKMSELAARHLLAQGVGKIFVSNRTPERALALAQKFGGEAIPFEQLYESADRADVVITSTGREQPIFRREHGEVFLSRRKNRPMFFIDIAVPRDVDGEMNKLDGIFVYNIDDLQSVVSEHVSDRRREAGRAEAIIEAEVQRFSAQMEGRQVVPTIVSLQEHLETIRQAEIDRVRGRLGPLNPEQELAIESLTRAIINKILHPPISALKAAALQPEAAAVVHSIRRLFNLREPSPPGDVADKRKAGPGGASGAQE